MFIDYELRDGLATYWLGWLLGGLYARRCINQMVEGVVTHFASGEREPLPFDQREVQNL